MGAVFDFFKEKQKQVIQKGFPVLCLRCFGKTAIGRPSSTFQQHKFYREDSDKGQECHRQIKKQDPLGSHTCMCSELEKNCPGQPMKLRKGVSHLNAMY